MDKVLKLIGFKEEEIQYYNQEINIFKKVLNLTEFHIEEAAINLPVNFDLSFQSIQDLFKVLFTCVLSDFKSLVAQENTKLKKDSHGNLRIIQMAVPMPNAIAGTVNKLSTEYHVTTSEYILIYLAGIVFDVYHQVGNMSSNPCKRCGLNLSRESLYSNPTYPKPTGIMTCLGYCDEISKTGEMLEIQYDIQHWHVSQIQGISFEEQSDYLESAVIDLVHEMTHASQKEIYSVLERMNRLNLEVSMYLDKIQHIVGHSKSIYVTFNEISLLNIFNLVYINNHHRQAIEILKLFLKELKSKMRQGDCIFDESVRLGCMHLPFTNARFDRIFRQNKASVIVVGMYGVGDCNKGTTSIHKMLHAFFQNKSLTSVQDKSRFYDGLIERYQLNGFIFGQFENDRALGANQRLVMDTLKHKDKTFYLSVYNWQAMGNNDPIKLETLVEVVKERIKLKCE